MEPAASVFKKRPQIPLKWYSFTKLHGVISEAYNLNPEHNENLTILFHSSLMVCMLLFVTCFPSGILSHVWGIEFLVVMLQTWRLQWAPLLCWWQWFPTTRMPSTLEVRLVPGHFPLTSLSAIFWKVLACAVLLHVCICLTGSGLFVLTCHMVMSVSFCKERYRITSELLLLWVVLWFSSVPAEISGYYLKLGLDCFFPLCFLFIIRLLYIIFNQSYWQFFLTSKYIKQIWIGQFPENTFNDFN